MENYYSIIKQMELSERDYTDRNGDKQMFVSKGFVLTDGIDTFYAEAVGDYARTLENFDQTVLHRVQLQVSVREYNDKEGKSRYSNEIRIVKIV